MLYELLAGHRIFASKDLIDLLNDVVENPAPPLPATVPRPLAAVVMKCLEKSPSARQATAGELADDLEAWLRGDPVRSGKEAAPVPVRRIPWKLVLAALAVIPLAFGVKALWDHQHSTVRVTTLADELNPPGTTGTGVSLREALRDAPEGGRIQFSSPGKIILADALGTLQISKNVRIEGAETEIHAGPDIDHIFVVTETARLSLENLTMSGEPENTRLRGSVCAIENHGALEAAGCRFLNNGGAGSGGAIVSQGALTLRRCVFQNNVSNMVGGALQLTGAQGRVDIDDCLFTGNRAAGNGGSAINVALLASGAHVRLTRCTLTGNVWQPDAKRQRKTDSLPESGGGALCIHAGTVSLENCIIAGNEAPEAEAARRDINGVFEQTGPNFIGGDPKDAPAGLGASAK
jgi:predicted outer membrane repeat protein